MKKIYLKDIAGYQEEKNEAKKIIEVLKNHEKYEKMGAYIPKGLVLSGNPGVGKTMFAKAIASESNVTFLEFESDEGETESQTIKSIKEIFKKARESAPAIVFIDELDELVMTDDYSSDYSRKTTKILLTEIDGISSTDGILVIATTNSRDSLPPALLRSGRMDKRISIGMPDAIDREAIFKLYLAKNLMLNDIDAHQLALKTGGFSCADIKTLINETIIDCASQNIKKITQVDFERNVPVIIFKDIRKPQRNGPSDLVCYHEIGHFITEYKLNGNVCSISTFKYGDIMGHVSYDEEPVRVEPSTRNNIKKKLIGLLGAMACEEVMCGDISAGSTDDVAKARGYLNKLINNGVFGFDLILPSLRVAKFSDDTIKASEKRLEKYEDFESNMLNDSYETAKKIINENKDLIKTIYIELKERQRLSIQEVESILKDFYEANKSN